MQRACPSIDVKITIVVVGKLKDAGLSRLVADYIKRISRYARVDEIELRDGPDDEVKARMQKAIPDRAHVVALEVEGRALSSGGLAKHIESCQNRSVGAICFLIGGSYGLPKTLSQSADMTLSLSALTLPHRLARLLLVEQVYRAYTIIRNEPYSH